MPLARRRPRLGYVLAATAAGMAAVNGSLARFLLDDGMSAAHVSQLRATVSFVLLAGVMALATRAVALSIAGSALVVEVYDARSLDTAGVVFSIAAAVTFAIYLVGFERAGQTYDAFTTLAWAFGFASLFWLLVSPPWTFAFHQLAGARNLALAFGVVVVGNPLPFLLIVAALRHLPAARVGVVATLEPVLAALVAWAVHDEALNAVTDRRRAARADGRRLGPDAPARARGAGGPARPLAAQPAQAARS